MSRNLYTSPRLTSGDKEVVSLADGFAFTGGPTRGFSENYPFAVLNNSFRVLAWEFHFNINAALILAAAGPGWGTGTFNNELLIGNGADTSISLGGGGAYSEAGFLFGVSLSISARARIDELVLQFPSLARRNFRETWNTILDVNKQATVDALKLILQAVARLLVVSPSKTLKAIVDVLEPLPPRPGLSGNYGIRNHKGESIRAVSENAFTQLSPKVTLRIDLSEFIPPVRALNKALSKLGTSIAFGPTIGIGLPINIQVQGIVIDSAVFAVTGTARSAAKNYYNADRNNRLEGSLPSGMGTRGYRPGIVGLRYKWSFGMDVVVGVYLHIKIFTMFSIAPEFVVGLQGLLGGGNNNKFFTGDLTNANFTFSQEIARGGLQPVEVVFEEPA